MVRGFDIVTHGTRYYGYCVLEDVLHIMNAGKHWWYAYYVWTIPDDSDVFTKEWMDTSDIVDDLNRMKRESDKQCNVMEMNLLRYPVRYDYPKPLKSYEEYLQSDCDLAVIIYDMNYVSLYMKCQDEIERLKRRFDHTQMQYRIVTDENDDRTGF